MNFRRWINTLHPSLFGGSVRGKKLTPHRNRYRPVLESLEDRVTPTNWSVTSLADTLVSGTLRYAINNSASGDIITFAVTGTITTGSVLTVSHSLTITGPGATSLSVNGNNNHEVFNFTSGTSTLSGVTVTNGLAATGSGIKNNGTLTLTNDAITANGAINNTTNHHGGGIYNTGTGSLAISGSTIDDNTSFTDGGGIENHGTMNISNSTIANNATFTNGGGIYNPAGDVTLTDVTIAGNHGWNNGIGSNPTGAGVYCSAGTFTLFNTVISNNYQAGAGPDFYGTIASANYCLIGNPSATVISTGANNLTDYPAYTFTPPTLAYNGGTTKTDALLAGSPAIGAGAPSQAGVTSQNGVLCPTAPDIGAYQHLIPAPAISASTANLAQNVTSIIIGGANFDTNASNDIVTFDNGVTGTVTAATSTSLNVSFTNAGAVSGLSVGTSIHANVAILYVGTSSVVQVATISPARPFPTVMVNTANLANSSTSVIINGSNFDPNAGNDIVAFNLGAIGTVTAASSSQLTVTLSTGFTSAGALTAAVTCDGLASASTVQVATVTASNWVITDPDGNAGSGNAGDVTLPFAVANAFGGDTITFASTLSGDAITLNSTLTIAHSYAIMGLGAANLTISGGGAVQVFNVSANVLASISNITITGGNSGNGGGIYNSGTLALTNDVVSANTAGVDGGGPGDGGGIYTSGTLTLTNDILTGNTAYFSGGGIYNSGTATLTNVTLSSNSASIVRNGGGALNIGAMTIADSSITSNSAGGAGGGQGGAGLDNGGTMIVTNSVFSGNSGNYGGALQAHDGTTTVIGCTFTGNLAIGHGGAVWLTDSGTATTMTIIDSTFTGNTAASTGGAIATGNLNLDNLNLNLTNSTVSGNHANQGGGLAMWSGSTDVATLSNTIVAGNTVSSSIPDVSGALSGGNNNLIGNGTGMTGITNGSNGNQVGTSSNPINPHLNSLGNNGGPTQTMSEQTSSPALGGGGAVTTVSATGADNVTTAIPIANLSFLAASSLPTLSSDSYFTIQIGSEKMAVTGASTSTLTVVRGINGTTAASHYSGTSVYLVSDQRGYLVPVNNPPVVDIGAYESTAANERPTIGSVSPDVGSQVGGTSVIITGANFTGTTAVFFGSTAATSFTVNSNTQITAVDPAEAPGTVDITVTGPLGNSAQSASDQFTYLTTTTTTLADNGPNPSTYGETVSFTATVSGVSDTDGETVFIEDADNANAVVASPTLSGGTVTFTISDLTVGTHDLFAVYPGDNNDAGSNSSLSPVTQVVNYSGPAPVFESIEVNGGTVQYHDAFGDGLTETIAGQNSVVEQILVTFNEPVTLASGAFSVVPYAISTDGLTHSGQVLVNSGPNPNQVVPLLNAPIQVGDGHQWIITFANNAATTPNGSGFYVLKDGVYSLNIDHTKVTANSQNMVADVGGPGASSFWALYGDTAFHDISGIDHAGYIGDGYSDASVGNADFQAFKACYNSDSTNSYAPPYYNVEFDGNLDGSVAASDFVQFKLNYNTDWQF
jgi:predicted outer membrane repeat protein